MIIWRPATVTVTVNAVAPGFVLTDLTGDLPQELLDEAKARTPLGRFTSLEDVSAAVAFLAVALGIVQYGLPAVGVICLAVSTAILGEWVMNRVTKRTVTIADGLLFVAAIDRHTLYALNSETGEVVWSYIAGGRVDSPPMSRISAPSSTNCSPWSMAFSDA